MEESGIITLFLSAVMYRQIRPARVSGHMHARLAHWELFPLIMPLLDVSGAARSATGSLYAQLLGSIGHHAATHRPYKPQGSA